MHYKTFMQNAQHILSQKELFASDFSQKRTGVYSFSFGGQEKDDEIYGSTGTSYTAQFWQYDSRIGRRWNLDPKPDPSISYYATFNLNPILFSDILGDTAEYTTTFGKSVKYEINIGKNGNLNYSFADGREASKRFMKKVAPIYQAMAQSSSGQKDIDFINSSSISFNINIDFKTKKDNSNSLIENNNKQYSSFTITPLQKSLKKSELPYNMALAGTMHGELLHVKNKDLETSSKWTDEEYIKHQTPGFDEYIKFYTPFLQNVTDFVIEYNNENKMGVPMERLKAPLKKLRKFEMPQKLIIGIEGK